MGLALVRRDDVPASTSEVFELLDFDRDGLADFNSLQKEFAGVMERNGEVAALGPRKVLIRSLVELGVMNAFGGRWSLLCESSNISGCGEGPG